MINNRGTSLIRIPIHFHVGSAKLNWEIRDEAGYRVFVGSAQSGASLPHAKLPEPWELVREYLAVNAKDERSVLAFLVTYGWFKAPEGSRGKTWSPKHPLHGQAIVEWFSLQDFAKVQDYVRQILSVGNPTLPTPWQPNQVQQYAIFFREVRSGPQAEVLVNGIYPSILATIQFKLVQGAKFRTCARKDCRLPFEVISRHKRRFCTQYCAHLTSLRQRRKGTSK